MSITEMARWIKATVPPTTLTALIPPDLPATMTRLDEGIHEIDPATPADLVGISAITGSAMPLPPSPAWPTTTRRC